MLLSVAVSVPPAEPVITLDEAKRHLRVDGDDEKELIEGLIAAAVGYLDGPDGVLGRALAPQTIVAVFDGPGPHRLPVEPVISSEAVTVDGITTITFEAGYPEGVPAPIKQAALLMIGDHYENREMAAEKWQPTRAFERLLTPWRRWV